MNKRLCVFKNHKPLKQKSIVIFMLFIGYNVNGELISNLFPHIAHTPTHIHSSKLIALNCLR